MITITSEEFDNAVSAVEDEFGVDLNARKDYSGRGMYGKTCVGIVVDDATHMIAFLHFLAEELEEDFLTILHELGAGGSDNMGLSTIYYWSHLKVEG